MKESEKLDLSKYWKITWGSFYFTTVIQVITNVFDLFPEAPLYIKLIPTYITLLTPPSVALFIYITKNREALSNFLQFSKKKIVFILVIFLIVSVSFLINNIFKTKLIDEELVNKYISYKNEYWKEIITQINGPLLEKKGLFPTFYKNAGNLLIFPATDGLVSVGFTEDFRFNDTMYNKWLKRSDDWNGPFISLASTNISEKFSIVAWTQIWTGNGIKIFVDSKEPNNIVIKGNFPEVPQTLLFDPNSGNYSPYTVINIPVSSEALPHFSLTLRDVEITEERTGRLIIPFIWQELEIMGADAIGKLKTTDAQIRASRELSSILAGLNLGIKSHTLSSNPSRSVLPMFLNLLSDFKKLLNTENLKVKELKRFLNLNPILISPSYLKIIPEVKFDPNNNIELIFAESAPNGTFNMLVKLEDSNSQIYLENGDRSPILNRALKQISDLRNWLRMNSNTAKKITGLNNLDADSQIILVIGRRYLLSEKESADLSSISKDYNYKTNILTYDDLYDKAMAWYNNLEKSTNQFLPR